MSRPLRIEYPLAYYHVMNRGMAYQNIFKEQTDYESFLRLLGESHELWGVRIIAYCLMENYYHLLIQTLEANLSRVMRHLDGIYTQRYNRKYKRDGPLFRGRYKAIVIEADRYLLAVARYIHHNPVEAKMVSFPEQYQWSSCREYGEVLKGERWPAWLDVKQLLDYFPQKGRKTAFREYMRSKIEEPERSFYEKKRWLPVFGEEEFIARIKNRLKKEGRSYDEIPEASPYVRPGVTECLKRVGEKYGVKEEEILQSRRGKRNEARSMAMFICRQIGGMRHREIAKRFGLGSYTAVSSTIGKMKREIEKGGRTALRFKQIRGRLHK